MIKIILKNKAELMEMPIVGVTKAGTKNKPSSDHNGFEQNFTEQDLKFINNSKAIGKIVKMWAGSKVPLNLVFCNLPKKIVKRQKNLFYGLDDGWEGEEKLTNQTIGGDASYYSAGMGLEQPGFLGKHRQRAQYGVDDEESKPEAIDNFSDDNDEEFNYPDDPDAASEIIGEILKFSNYKRVNTAINFIIIGNWGNGKIPLSGWIVAHKLSHALLDASGDTDTILQLIRRDIHHSSMNIPKDVLQHYSLDSLILTNIKSLVASKSGRDGKVTNSIEAMHELFAYYILNNKLKLNPVGIESTTAYILKAINQETQVIEKETVQQIIEFFRQRLEFYFQHILENAIGSTLID
jgi:hypothetical protein